MTKTLKKISMEILFLVSFFIPQIVGAFTIENFTVTDSYSTSAVQNYALEFTAPVSGYLTNAHVTMKRNSGGSAQATLYLANPPYLSSGTMVCATTIVSIPSGSPSFILPVWATQFDTACSVTKNSKYWLVVPGPVNGTDTATFYGTSANSFADAQFGRVLSGGNSTTLATDLSIIDAQFWLEFKPTGTAVDFYNRRSPISDFYNWALQFNVPTTSLNDALYLWKIGVEYSYLDSNNVEQNKGDYGYFSPSSTSKGYVRIPKLADFTSSTLVTAYAYIRSLEDNSVVASSSAYVFTINNTVKSDLGAWTLSEDSVNTPSSTLIVCDNINCSSGSNIIDRAFCYTTSFLFCPSNDSMSRLISIQDQVANKPPFGYIGVYTTALENLSSATSTTSTINSLDYDLPLTSLSTISIFSTIKTILTWLLWLLFGFYIYRRFKYFSLHG